MARNSWIFSFIIMTIIIIISINIERKKTFLQQLKNHDDKRLIVINSFFIFSFFFAGETNKKYKISPLRYSKKFFWLGTKTKRKINYKWLLYNRTLHLKYVSSKICLACWNLYLYCHHHHHIICWMERLDKKWHNSNDDDKLRDNHHHHHCYMWHFPL